ncbi:MAG: hypothetical protein WC967_10135 [Balneolaceae bacterium]
MGTLLTEIKSMDETVTYGSSTVLSISKKSGFLALALIAGVTIWQSGEELLLMKTVAFSMLAISIFISIFTHFWVRIIYSHQLQKIIDGNFKKNSFLVSSACFFGVLQFIFLAIGTGITFYCILI